MEDLRIIELYFERNENAIKETDAKYGKGSDTMKKKIWLPLLILVMAAIIVTVWYFRPVGTVEGPEWNILHVDGITYISEHSAGFDIPYNRSDRGLHIGIIKSGDYIFHIYEVKGDSERNYLYWTWEWEGEMYVRQDVADALREK